MIFSRSLLLSWLGSALLPALVLGANTRQQPSRPAEDTGAYKGAIVIDAASGKVLFEDRADDVSPPASMAKLMTYAVLHDRIASGTLALHTPVRIDRSDAAIGGTQVFLDPRETFSVEELIHAMMVQSANDAAHALARVSAGSVPAFVESMNAKAREIGMTKTTFRTPHGLPPSSRKPEDGDLTTPRDFALLSKYLIERTDVLTYTSVTTRTFGAGTRTQPMEMKNHNKLLGRVAGVDGLKTGFTNAAGYCLSATAQRNGRRVILVIMGSLGPKGQRDLGRARDLKAIELIERGFNALPPGPAAAVAAAGKSNADSPLRPAPLAPANAPKPPPPASVPKAAAPAAPAPAAASGGPEPVIKFSIPKR